MRVLENPETRFQKHLISPTLSSNLQRRGSSPKAVSKSSPSRFRSCFDSSALGQTDPRYEDQLGSIPAQGTSRPPQPRQRQVAGTRPLHSASAARAEVTRTLRSNHHFEPPERRSGLYSHSNIKPPLQYITV